MAIVKTLTFNESAGVSGQGGWTSFWDYKPSEIFSMRGRYYTTNGYKLYEHYGLSSTVGNFYGTQYSSEITLILNSEPSVSKNFKTINYEGSDGWEVINAQSDKYQPIDDSQSDIASPIKSYSEGAYISRGVEYRVGFDKRENKYFANIINDGVTLRGGEVITGDGISGVKGFFLEVTLSTDQTTNNGGIKQLFSVASEYVISSI